jgi:hypothetical protein
MQDAYEIIRYCLTGPSNFVSVQILHLYRTGMFSCVYFFVAPLVQPHAGCLQNHRVLLTGP